MVSKKFYFYLFFLFKIASLSANGKILTFDDAVQRTLSESPKLTISSDEIGEKAGISKQSRLYPNPVAAYSVENVLGNKNWQGWESAESRYEVGQLVELAGKRRYRSTSADYQLYSAQAGYEAKKILVLNRLLKIFSEVAGVQEQLKLAQEQTQIAEEIFKTVSAKVEAGKVSLIQQNKAEIAFYTAKISLEKAVADFEKAREKLSILWGSTCPDFDAVAYGFYELEIPKNLEECHSLLIENPELVRSQFEYFSAHQNLKLEKVGAVPDLTLTLGYKTLQDTRNKGLILGASMPIPVFNQNQGNIQKARFETQRVQDQYAELQLVLENKLSIAHKEVVRAYKEAELFQSTVLKTALQSFEFAEEGYKEGKFEYLDMLDSQRTLFDVREKYIQSLVNYHKSRADIEYLTSQDESL